MIFVLVPIAFIAAATAMAANHFRNNIDHDIAEWHVDPLTAPTPTTPNSYRATPEGAAIEGDTTSPTFAISPADLGAAFDAVAMGDDKVEVLAGSAADGHVTYIQRSKLMAFPDYISVRFVDDAAGSTLAVFSRSRYGKSDLGVNKKRITRWLGQLPTS